MCNKSLERSVMSALAEAQMLVRGIAGDKGSVKERIRRAAMRIQKLSFNRVRELFYGLDRCHVWAEELDELRRIARFWQEEEVTTEYAKLCNRLDRIEAMLARMEQTDPDFFVESVAAVRASISKRR